MANSGYVQTTLYKHMRQRVDWYATVDKIARTATIHWSASTVWSGTDDTIYHLCHKPQYIKINGVTLATWSTFYKHSGGSYSYLDYNDSNHIYYAFTKPDSKLAQNYNLKNYHDDPVKYGDKGRPRWIHVLGKDHHSGTYTIKFDSNGDASFTLDCNFAWHEDNRIKASNTFHLNNIGKDKHSVTFDKNMDDYSVTNMPSNLTNVQHGSLITIPEPAVCEAFDFLTWGSYAPGRKISVYDNITLKATWSRKSYEWIFYLMGGTTKLTSLIHEYDIPTTMPTTDPQEDEDWYTYKWDGEYLRGSSQNINSGNVFVLRRQGKLVNLTINANGGSYLDGTTSRVAQVRYNNWDYFNNSYYNFDSWLPTKNGAKLRGFTTTPHSPITKNESVPADTVWLIDGSDNTPLNDYIKSGGTVLYALWEYTTTVYVYTNGSWQLAIPYVYTDGKWNQTVSYVREGDSWKV